MHRIMQIEEDVMKTKELAGGVKPITNGEIF